MFRPRVSRIGAAYPIANIIAHQLKNATGFFRPFRQLSRMARHYNLKQKRPAAKEFFHAIYRRTAF